MSLQRALDALNGKRLDRVAQMVEPSHSDYVKHITGIDPIARTPQALAAFYEHVDIDATFIGYLEPADADQSRQQND